MTRCSPCAAVLKHHQSSVHSVQQRDHLLHLPLSLHSTPPRTPTSITFRCAMRLGDSGDSGSAEREDADGMALGVSEKFSMRRFTSSISSRRSTCVGLRWRHACAEYPKAGVAEALRACCSRSMVSRMVFRRTWVSSRRRLRSSLGVRGN